MSQLYTLSAAVKLLEDLEKKCNDIQNSQTALPTEQDKAKEAKEHLLSAKNILNKWERVLGGTKEILDLRSNDVDLYSRGDTYRSRYQSHIAPPIDDDFVNWAIAFNGCAIEFHQDSINKTRELVDSFVIKSSQKRKKLLKGMLVTIIVISIPAAIVAILGLFLPGDPKWPTALATILGIIDFAFGACGFSVERLSDMKEQTVGRGLQEIDRLQSDDLDKSTEIAKQIVGEININSNNRVGWFSRLTINSSSCEGKSDSLTKRK